jgi:hypothetical protein
MEQLGVAGLEPQFLSLVALWSWAMCLTSMCHCILNGKMVSLAPIP